MKMEFATRFKRGFVAGLQEKGVVPAYVATAGLVATGLAASYLGDDGLGDFCLIQASLLGGVTLLHHYTMGTYSLRGSSSNESSGAGPRLGGGD